MNNTTSNPNQNAGAPKKKDYRGAYTIERAEEICDAIATNPTSLATLCKENPTWPSVATIFRWIAHNPDFYERYRRAKTAQIEVIVDELLDIADNSPPKRAKVQIQARQWLATQLLPHIYGNKVQQEIKLKTHDDDVLQAWKLNSLEKSNVS